MIVLFYGQPASGKTTLADYYTSCVVPPFKSRGYIRIDGDEWRDFKQNKDYSKSGRMINLTTAFDMALFLEKKNFIPVLSFVTPYQEARDYLSKAENLLKVYLYCHEDRGRSAFFVSDFEPPDSDSIIINTSIYNKDESLKLILL